MKFIKLGAGVLGSMLMVGLANADQVILDDLIVDGSACVGQDCVNGESFGFDTIRVKENNLRIKFDDTSSTSSFPSNDWQLTANDSSNGGQNKFSIDDISGGRTPFTVEAGAPSHSLYVDDGGRIGLGTATPVVEVHVVDGDTPTLRLEQDGSSGFTPQTWDLAGNETNIFIRDATNGSTLPFRIRPGAPSSSIDIAADGDVGFGASTIGKASNGETAAGGNGDDVALHLRRSNSLGAFLVEETGGTAGTVQTMLELRNNGGSRIRLEDSSTTDNDWVLNNNTANQFQISETFSGVNEFLINRGGDVVIAGSITTGGGTCGGGCDMVFTPEYEIDSIEEHARKMWESKHLPNVGPTKEGQPFNLSDKTGRMLNELETAHIYIEQLHNQVKQLAMQKDEAISALEERLSRLESK